MQLESRTLYSASPIDVVTDVETDVSDDLAVQAAAVDESLLAEESQPAADANESEQPEEQQERHELVLVDTSANNYLQLVDDILAQQTEGRNIDVRLLDADRDGIEQMTSLLRDYQDLDAVHLVSHGNQGAVKFGSTWLNSDSISGYVSDIVGWRDSFAADADMLIYGCELAESVEGRTLIDMLAMVCDCDVAASDDATGHETLGGDWRLEYEIGSIESTIAFSIDVRHEWQGVLLSDPATDSDDEDESTLELTELALAFEENVGQLDSSVDFLARGGGYSVFLSEGDAVIDLVNGDSRHVVRLDVLGADADAQVTGEDALGGVSNYLIGDSSEWRTGIQNFSSVVYENVYEGIDIRYYGNQRQLQYDFIVGAHRDPNAIRLNFDGVAGLEINSDGELQLKLDEAGNFLTFNAPFSYQLADDGSQIVVESGYVIHADGTVGFTLGEYDLSRELVIDPILDYTTFVGGTGYDSLEGITADDSGNAYITGWTSSTDFPTTAGAYDTSYNTGSYDIYVAKLSSDGSSLVYSTFIGGSGSDQGNSIAVDGTGNVYVVGSSNSSNLPTLNAYQNSLSGTSDAVLIKLNSTGNMLLYSSYLGGTGTESAYDVVLDNSGFVHVVGSHQLGESTDQECLRFNLGWKR